MKEDKRLVLGMIVGIVAGTIVGVATKNLGLWIAIGVSFGAALGFIIKTKKK